jgi:hypothetical protein
MGKDDHTTAPDGYSYTQLVAPVFAGFSLPAIIIFVQDADLGKPWHNIILSLLAIAASLFMASIGLMTVPIMKEWPRQSGDLRGLLSVLGICVVAVALFMLCLKAINQGWSLAVLIPLLIGSLAPAVISFVLWFKQKDAQAHHDTGASASLPGFRTKGSRHP